MAEGDVGAFAGFAVGFPESDFAMDNRAVRQHQALAVIGNAVRVCIPPDAEFIEPVVENAVAVAVEAELQTLQTPDRCRRLRPRAQGQSRGSG